MKQAKPQSYSDLKVGDRPSEQTGPTGSGAYLPGKPLVLAGTEVAASFASLFSMTSATSQYCEYAKVAADGRFKRLAHVCAGHDGLRAASD